jgi:hypothetical protein
MLSKNIYKKLKKKIIEDVEIRIGKLFNTP